MKFATALTFAAVAFAGVQAQSQSSAGALPTGVTQCILGCISQASSANGCSGITDVNCLCTNQQFQQTATSCLESSCSQQEVQAALQLQQAQCAAVTSAASSTATSGAATSAATSSAASGASSIISSLSSAASSAASSLSSAASAVRSNLSSGISSATNAATSAASSAANSNNAARGMRAEFATGGFVGVGMAFVGVLAGAALVL